MRTKPRSPVLWSPAGVVGVLIWVAAVPVAQPVSAFSSAPEPAPPLTAAVQSKIDADVRAASTRYRDISRVHGHDVRGIRTAKRIVANALPG